MVVKEVVMVVTCFNPRYSGQSTPGGNTIWHPIRFNCVTFVISFHHHRHHVIHHHIEIISYYHIIIKLSMCITCSKASIVSINSFITIIITILIVLLAGDSEVPRSSSWTSATLSWAQPRPPLLACCQSGLGKNKVAIIIASSSFHHHMIILSLYHRIIVAIIIVSSSYHHHIIIIKSSHIILLVLNLTQSISGSTPTLMRYLRSALWWNEYLSNSYILKCFWFVVNLGLSGN